jgi:IS5 family transposase
MIIDRYDPINLFEMMPKLNLKMEPELAQLDRLLEDDVLFKRVKVDLSRRYPNSARLGRHSTPVEVILRMLVVKRLYNWSYEQTEHFVSDSIVLRQFCRLYLEGTPDDTTLIRWANVIGSETVASLNERAVELARSLKVTRGRKLRVDSMVVETNIHHPTDSALLADGVRVLSRLLRRAKKALQAHADDPGARRLLESFEHFVPLVEQGIAQASRRVLDDEQLPAAEKVLSLFEEHTQIITRHKAGKAREFGRKVLIDEVDGGIISRYEILEEVGREHPHLPASLEAHQEHFGRAPYLLAGDRGLYSAENERLAQESGVKRIVLPKSGRLSHEREQHEKQRWFKQGFRFRAGIEGRISVLGRAFGLSCCLDHGEEGMGRWVGWGVLAHNLRQISRTQAARQAA